MLFIKIDNNSLIIIILVVTYIFCLIGAYITFKILGSTAEIKNKNYKAGGAIAGCLLLLIFSGTFVSKIIKQINENNTHFEKPVEEIWNIVGNVQLEDQQRNDGIKVSVQPPSPITSTDLSGDFSFYNIPVTVLNNKKKNASLKFECQNYLPRTINLYDTNYFKIDSVTNTFLLTKKIKLIKLNQ